MSTLNYRPSDELKQAGQNLALAGSATAKGVAEYAREAAETGFGFYQDSPAPMFTVQNLFRLGLYSAITAVVWDRAVVDDPGTDWNHIDVICVFYIATVVVGVST